MINEQGSDYLVVMPEQLQEGYRELSGMVVHERKYVPLRKLEDGNWVVLAPKEPNR